MGVVPQSVPRVYRGCGKIIYWCRECHKYEFVVHTDLAYVPIHPRVPRYIIIIERMIILVGNVPSVSWSTSWGQLIFLAKLGLQGFSMTVEISITSIESVVDVGSLAIPLI